MGFNTTIMIHNDGLHEIEDHPEEFAQNLVNAVSRADIVEEFGVGSHVNMVTVIGTAHADVPRLYFSQGNWLSSFDMHYIERMRDRGQLGLMKERIKEAKRLIKRAEEDIMKMEAT